MDPFKALVIIGVIGFLAIVVAGVSDGKNKTLQKCYEAAKVNTNIKCDF